MFQTIYPPESNIVQIEGSLKEDHVSSIRLKCATKEEFLRWLCNHQLLSGVTFRVLKTRPSVGKCVLYSVSEAKEPTKLSIAISLSFGLTFKEPKKYNFPQNITNFL